MLTLKNVSALDCVIAGVIYKAEETFTLVSDAEVELAQNDIALGKLKIVSVLIPKVDADKAAWQPCGCGTHG